MDEEKEGERDIGRVEKRRDGGGSDGRTDGWTDGRVGGLL